MLWEMTRCCAVSRGCAPGWFASPFQSGDGFGHAPLFEPSGRKRTLKTDAMIAATALVARARLATNNERDFSRFPGVALI
jgi:inosine/xanthosine triphosphate pyrophosphatase family protein